VLLSDLQSRLRAAFVHRQPRPLGDRVDRLVQLLDPVPLLSRLAGPAAVALDREIDVGMAEPGGDHGDGNAALEASDGEQVAKRVESCRGRRYAAA
jgi:hypothetical protein